MESEEIKAQLENILGNIGTKQTLEIINEVIEEQIHRVKANYADKEIIQKLTGDYESIKVIVRCMTD